MRVVVLSVTIALFAAATLPAIAETERDKKAKGAILLLVTGNICAKGRNDPTIAEAATRGATKMLTEIGMSEGEIAEFVAKSRDNAPTDNKITVGFSCSVFDNAKKNLGL